VQADVRDAELNQRAQRMTVADPRRSHVLFALVVVIAAAFLAGCAEQRISRPVASSSRGG
jgi:hypothetical protein